MAKRIKKGDTVVAIAGKNKDDRGTVLAVDWAKQTVLVEGLNLYKKTVRRSNDSPQGGINDVERPMHISNVMLAERHEARAARRSPSEPVADTSPAGDEEATETAES
ncbi:MAG: 50S ribosomal protein L24 [Lentisphaeria bacterium]|nr:50S ribosomal protein L24 [Lentisphaeria bacterium]